MIVGCTGHQNIPDEAHTYVAEHITSQLSRHPSGSLTGVCSLAVGADQMFARLTLELGGRLSVVLPATGYKHTFDAAGLTAYRDLLARASDVEVLGFDAPTEEAFLAAGKRVVEQSQMLLAVWDGADARGKGGTGDVVRYAQEQGVPVEVVWPEGVDR